METRLPASDAAALPRCAAMVAVGATMLLGDRVAVATASTGGGFRGDLLAHLDAGRALIVVAVAVAALLPWVDPNGRDATRRSVLEWLRDGAVVVWSLWTATVIAVVAAVHPTFGPRQLFSSLLVFRPIGGGDPINGLAVGPLVLELVLVAAAAPFLGIFVRSGRSRLSGWTVAALLVVAGVLVRVAVIGAGRTGPLGALSWLPADLDLVGAGLAVALLLCRPASASWDATIIRWIRLGGAAAAFLAYLTLAATIDQPVVPGTQSASGLHGQALLALIAACGAVVAVVLPGRPRGTRSPGPAWWLMLTAPGILLLHETAFVVVARQYRERLSTGLLGIELDGAALPVFLWALLISAAAGIVMCAVIVQPLARLLARRWSPHWFLLTSAGVVAGAFVWRVVALMTIAPDRVDGGDPLFYHTTANVLAAGRGFPEPLKWIAFGRPVASAFHGPLFPMMLSLSSRIGGTAYIDHRLMATLFGTAAVLGVLLVGHYLGGRTVALVAGLIAAFYPNLWLIDGVLFPEGLMAALVVFTILVAYRWNDRPRYVLAVVLGALIGLTALTRGEGVFLMVLLVPPLMLRQRQLAMRDRWKQVVVTAVACLAVLAPWMVRNLVTFEEFVPLSTNGNEVLVYANCDDAYHGKFLGFWSFDCQERIRQATGDPPGDESQRAKYWREVGVEYAKDHISRLPVVVAARVGRQWDVFRPWQNAEFAPIEGRDKQGARLGLIAYYALVAAGINGVRVLWRRRITLLPLAAQVVSVTITSAFAYGTVRFRAPAEPVLCLLAAVGITPLLTRAWNRLLTDDEPPIADPSAYVLGGTAIPAARSARRRRWSWTAFTAAATVAVLTLLPVRGMFRSTGGTMEEGFMLAFPERMLKGDVPNIDFLHLYGPGALELLSYWYRIFGVTLEAERTFGLLQHIGIITALWVLARAWGRGAACATAALSVFLVMTPIGLTAMAWNGAVALGLWSVVFAIRSRTATEPRTIGWMLTLAGLLAGLALTFRPDLALALVLAHGWLLWRRPGWKRYLVGLVVGLLPLLVHVARIGVGRAVETMLLDPVLRLRPGRELPRPPSWNVLDGALQAIAEEVPPWWRFPAMAASHQLFLWFFALPIVAFLVAGTGLWLYRRTAGAPRAIALAAAGLFGVGLLPQAFQRPDSTHLTWVACVSWPLLVPTIIELVRICVPRLHPRARVAIAGTFLAGLMFVIAPFYTYRTYLLYARVTVGDLPPALEVERNGRRFYMGDTPPWRATAAAIETLDELAQPGERLFVGPADLRRTWYSDTFFYYLFPELTPATYFMEMDPGIANADDSPLADEVASADWVLLTNFWAGWREPNTAMEYGSDAPNEVVRSQFCLVESFEDDLVLLYRRC